MVEDVYYIHLNKETLLLKSPVREKPAAQQLPKATFIEENNFFRREMTMFKLMEEMEMQECHPWGAKAYLYNSSVLHSRVALAAVARFHAAVADHEARRSRALARPYSLMEDYGHLIVENNFRDTPWIAAGAKLAANIIQHFSDKHRNTVPDLEDKLLKQFLAACNDVSERKDTLNVLIHKDLWANNIMFKHEAGVPTNAILVDFQCLRYAPPAFDVMLCWYCTTDRSFRERYEREMLQHYFDTFISTVNEVTKEKLKGLGYDYKGFLRWVEECRRFGLLVSIMLYPYILLDQVTAREMFDNPETFLKHTNEDRSEPVLEYARRSDGYRTRQLEVCEDFVERYLKA
ncbi:hypothetical protein MSG28_011521 [Choristoneura fumiferana]|uniref:Uncharacterized protein n=1 Tax=Choristoneura fumiferana TaxID=7141 RepID=A0ACC0JNL7_CHOFU|nr:hypothetical protein MSG28_011521 [Choristoneura fumiferana]